MNFDQPQQPDFDESVERPRRREFTYTDNSGPFEVKYEFEADSIPEADAKFELLAKKKLDLKVRRTFIFKEIKND